MARSSVRWDGGFLGLFGRWVFKDRNHWAWSHVINLYKEKLVTGQMVPSLEACEMMSISRLGSNSMEEGRRTKHL